MKKFMIAGGFLGFLIGLIFGTIQHTAWPAILWRASVAALCAGILMRWWARLWLRSLQQACEQSITATAGDAAVAKPLAGQPNR